MNTASRCFHPLLCCWTALGYEKRIIARTSVKYCVVGKRGTAIITKDVGHDRLSFLVDMSQNKWIMKKWIRKNSFLIIFKSWVIFQKFCRIFHSSSFLHNYIDSMLRSLLIGSTRGYTLARAFSNQFSPKAFIWILFFYFILGYFCVRTPWIRKRNT